MTIRDIFGFQVDLRSTLVHLAVLIFALSGLTGGDPVLAGIFAALLVGSIYLHELGHAFAARSQGVKVLRIVLHGGGGLCAYEKATPRQDVVIIAAAPLTNLALWLICRELAEAAEPGYARFALALASDLNLFLGLFNLMPILPLDGGRLFYLGLWYRLPQLVAIRIASLVSAVVGIVWIPLAVYVYLTFGYILFFFPPVRENWARFKAAGRRLAAEGAAPPPESGQGR